MNTSRVFLTYKFMRLYFQYEGFYIYVNYHHKLKFYVEKTCLVGLLIRSILSGKIFSCAKSNELTDQQGMFCFNHASAFYMSNNIVKNVDVEFKTDTSTGNPTGNLRCHTLASHALNMSCNFGQSAHSIESRCVVYLTTHTEWVGEVTSKVMLRQKTTQIVVGILHLVERCSPIQHYCI